MSLLELELQLQHCNVFTVTFIQFNVSLLYKSINFIDTLLKKLNL